MSSSLISLSLSAKTPSGSWETPRQATTSCLPLTSHSTTLLQEDFSLQRQHWLGLSSKFVPIPKAHTTQKKAMESFERFKRDFGWKVYFDGEEDYDVNIKSKSKYSTKSTKMPPLPLPDIGLRVVTFKIAIRNRFKPSHTFIIQLHTLPRKVVRKSKAQT